MFASLSMDFELGRFLSTKLSDKEIAPLSLYLFLLAVEPLVATINNDTRIEGLGKGRKRNVKCPSYADDLTLTLVGSPSVCLAFEIAADSSVARR